MASITQIEKLKLEKILEMECGYVLDFSNNTFQQFILDIVKIDIYNTKYEKYGDSKANRFRALWEIETDNTVGKLIEEMLLFHEELKLLNDQEYKHFNQKLLEECFDIVYKLQGKKQKKEEPVDDIVDFLKKEVDEISISSLDIDNAVIVILQQRIVEVKKCLKAGAYLSVIFLCGSILEGLLLGVALKNNKEFNQSSVSPKDKVTGKVKQYPDWTLNNFIDVAHDVRFIGLDVKKYSHALRDFRNYIHPFAQMSSGFNPDKHTAKISWQVLKAALNDIYEKVK